MASLHAHVRLVALMHHVFGVQADANSAACEEDWAVDTVPLVPKANEVCDTLCMRHASTYRCHTCLLVPSGPGRQNLCMSMQAMMQALR